MKNEECSPLWRELMEKEELFWKAAAHFRNNLSLEEQVRDIRLTLQNREGQLIVTRLMYEGYINEEIVLHTYIQLIDVAFHGPISAASWATKILCNLNTLQKQQLKNDLLLLVNQCMLQEKEDETAVRFGQEILEAFSG